LIQKNKELESKLKFHEKLPAAEREKMEILKNFLHMFMQQTSIATDWIILRSVEYEG